MPGASHGQRNLAGYSPWGREESDMNKQRGSRSGKEDRGNRGGKGSSGDQPGWGRTVQDASKAGIAKKVLTDFTTSTFDN